LHPAGITKWDQLRLEDAMKTHGRAPLWTTLGALLLLAAAPAWSQTGSLDTWVDTCEIDADLELLLNNEAMIFSRAHISQQHPDGTYELFQQPYTHSGIQPPLVLLCSDSRFYGQPQSTGDSFRSAVQVGPDLILTAWHVAPPNPNDIVVVFGLHARMQGDTCVLPDFSHVPAANVYWPTEIVVDGNAEIGRDFMLVRLDRPAHPTFPRVRRSGRGRAGDSMTTIGHPDRLATKVDVAGSLLGYVGTEPNLFPSTTNLHALIGSSGSMVYNRTERFIETVIRHGMGTDLVPHTPDPTICRTLIHVDGAAQTHTSVKVFAPFVPSWELLADLDTVTHVGPVGGPFTNPVKERTFEVDDGAPQPVDYQLEFNGLTPQPQLVIQLDGPAQGTLEPGESFSSTETFKANLAGCGVYERTYRARDLTHGFTDTVRHRFEIGIGEFTVDHQGRTQIGDVAKPFEKAVGVEYTVTNLRPSPLTVTVTASTLPHPSWVSLNDGVPGAPVILEIPPHQTAVVTARPDPALTLAPGLYPATLHFAGESGPGCPAVAGVERQFDFDWGHEGFGEEINIPVPNGSSLGVVRTFNVPENFCIADVNVGVRVNDAPVDHLRVRVTSPEGTSRLLWNHGTTSAPDPGDPSGPVLWRVFDDDGPFPPVELLSALNGQQGGGDWQLHVVDDVAGGGNGRLTNFSLEFRACP
jgi:subtilisin-like proprotein convertase family protein